MDLLHQSRMLEDMKIQLVSNSQEFNISDAFSLLKPHNYKADFNPLKAKITQAQFRDSLLDIGVQNHKASMDRIYLLFQRWNVSKDDLLDYGEFLQMICPANQRVRYELKQREVSVNNPRLNPNRAF